ncbi:hypothetical protein SY83_14400 [Paenibacillus swuensis]|uniref:Transglutaminase-like domain-containing protein n=1 Tax=Paenibacillus swuensis TaxID=1178515 RepID=A0A172TPF1_9BACL|nr:hypothetical protein SY83_14400 [Paenibacillus swuensis]
MSTSVTGIASVKEEKRSWPHQLNALFIGLILVQFIIWFDEYWLKDTVYLSFFAIGLTLVLELLTLVPAPVRVLLQLVGIIAAHFIWLEGFLPWSYVADGMAGRMELLQYNLGIMDPFIWYVLAVWAIYGSLLRGLTTQYRLFCFILFSLFAFAIMDSFSPLQLWDQIAIVLGSGLCMLIVRHYADLQKKHPVSWQAMLRKPMRILLPIVLTGVIVLSAGFAAPTLSPVLTDPYTAWQHAKGEPVGGSGKTEGSNPDSKVSETTKKSNTKSGYSRNDEKLGGGFDYSFEPVMTVTSSAKSYWRGETKSNYTGKGWKKGSDEGDRDLTGFNTELPKYSGFNASKLETEEVVQRFAMLKPHKPILFGAKGLERMVDEDTSVTSKENLRITWIPREEELRWYAPGYPASYEVVSQVPIIDEAALRKVPFLTNPGEELQPYLELPRILPDRVDKLAKEIVKDAKNPYDQAKAIETYLSITYAYNPKPDVAKAKSYDFVDGFLFEMKEGYCDYFSTAMAVLSRSVGLPARWVKGYASGTTPIESYDIRGTVPPEALADVDGEREYTVRNSDAHSWVEIYLEGYGWIPFEPTAGFSMPLPMPEETAVTPEVEETPEAVTPVVEETSAWPKAAWISVAALLLLLALAGAAAYFYRDAIAEKLGAKRGPAQDRANQRVVAEFERYLRFARRKGYPRGEHETARETVARWSREYSWLEKDLLALLPLFEKAKYSPAVLSDEELHAALGSIQSLRTAMK